MPITAFQSGIFKVIAAHRNPDNYVAGGIVLNRHPDSARFSKDIDLFHDKSESVRASALQDVAALRAGGYQVDFVVEEQAFLRARVTRDGDRLGLDWAADSAFRFFPTVPDDVLGYRLHDADAATNKVIAAASRQKVRDFIDLMEMDRRSLPLGIAVWAAVAKDEGLTPEFVVNELRRNSKINPDTLDSVVLATRQDAVTLKREWLDCFARAEALMTTFPPESFGCLFLDAKGEPARGEKFDPSWTPHFGSVKGAWPNLAP